MPPGCPWLRGPRHRYCARFHGQLRPPCSELVLACRFFPLGDGARARRRSWSGAHGLPAFLILGVYQSGMRGLYTRIQRHPDVVQRPANSALLLWQVRAGLVRRVVRRSSAAARARPMASTRTGSAADPRRRATAASSARWTAGRCGAA